MIYATTIRDSSMSTFIKRPVQAALAILVLPLALLSTGCGAEAERNPESTEASSIQIGAENVVTVTRGTVVVGPIVSGELRPEREATVRAELGGSMLQVVVEEGQSVARGALLGRIET